LCCSSKYTGNANVPVWIFCNDTTATMDNNWNFDSAKLMERLHQWNRNGKRAFNRFKWVGVTLGVGMLLISAGDVEFSYGAEPSPPSPPLVQLSSWHPVSTPEENQQSGMAVEVEWTEAELAMTPTFSETQEDAELAEEPPSLNRPSGPKQAPPGFSKRPADKKQRLSYIRRFSKVAQEEMKRFGIPASITLAQGLLESNAGTSPLALHNQNHFGIKCFEKHCRKGHCANFSDDSHKDFFRIYQTVWESYRAHSKFLQKDRYKPLFKLKSTDYKGWAKGLQKAGYATDQRYAEKLIRLIEAYELQQYDR
jgi:flagellum-specific peptidoglycan hydrolase FlgJ